MTTKDPEAADFKRGSYWAGIKRFVRRTYQIPGVRRTVRVIAITAGRLYQDDGWAMASHLTLSALMALFPFLIFVAALAGFFGASGLADQAAHYLFDTLPENIAKTISDQVYIVLTERNPSLLTISVIVTFYLAMNGVEAVRAALTRAYGSVSTRPFWLLRLQSAGFVVIGALAFMALALLGVLGPLIWEVLQRWFPDLANLSDQVQIYRYVIVGSLLAAALTASHLWLPGRGKWRHLRIWPGIVATLLGWWVATSVFAAYLKGFANYASTYAGLTSIVTALFYLYIMSLILIFGAELNAAIARTSPRASRRREEKKAEREEKREEKKEERKEKKEIRKAKRLPIEPPANDD
jgi:membrane protein